MVWHSSSVILLKMSTSKGPPSRLFSSFTKTARPSQRRSAEERRRKRTRVKYLIKLAQCEAGFLLTIQTGILQIVRIGIILHELGMCATCESAEGARSHRRIEVRRATDKRELIQALVLTVGAIGRGYLRNKSRQSAPNGIPD